MYAISCLRKYPTHGQAHISLLHNYKILFMRKTHGSKTIFCGFITLVVVNIELKQNPLQVEQTWRQIKEVKESVILTH